MLSAHRRLSTSRSSKQVLKPRRRKQRYLCADADWLYNQWAMSTIFSGIAYGHVGSIVRGIAYFLRLLGVVFVPVTLVVKICGAMVDSKQSDGRSAAPSVKDLK